MGNRNAVLLHKVCGLPVKYEQWFASIIVGHYDVVEMYALTETCTHGFGSCFLRGESTSQKTLLIGIPMKLIQLSWRQNTFGKPVTEAIQVLPHAYHVYDIGTDAEDHLADSSINRFISRTDSCMPVKSARAMIA